MVNNVYVLKSGNEVINKTKAHNFEEALEYFAAIKKLDKNKLLEIYKIEIK